MSLKRTVTKVIPTRMLRKIFLQVVPRHLCIPNFGQNRSRILYVTITFLIFGSLSIIDEALFIRNAFNVFFQNGFLKILLSKLLIMNH